MQVAVNRVAQILCDHRGDPSQEFDAHSEHCVVILMPEGLKTIAGGTMKLGKKTIYFLPGSGWSKLRAFYGDFNIVESSTEIPKRPTPLHRRVREGMLRIIGKDETGN